MQVCIRYRPSQHSFGKIQALDTWLSSSQSYCAYYYKVLLVWYTVLWIVIFALISSLAGIATVNIYEQSVCSGECCDPCIQTGLSTPLYSNCNGVPCRKTMSFRFCPVRGPPEASPTRGFGPTPLNAVTLVPWTLISWVVSYNNCNFLEKFIDAPNV